MCLGEYISSLVSRRDRMKVNSATNHMLMNKVAVDLDMFGAIIKNIIVSNQNSTAIVTTKNISTGMDDTKILK